MSKAGKPKKGTCGFYGGRNKDDSPCGYKAGVGGTMCKRHIEKMVVVEVDRGLAEEDTPPEWLAEIREPKKRAFLAAFREVGTAVQAERQSGVHSSMHRHWKNPLSPHYDETYARLFEEHAKPDAADRLETEARRRAILGVRRPVLYQGVQVMVRKLLPDGTPELDAAGHPVLVPLYEVDYSDTLLIALLNANKPEKFKYRHEHAGPKGGPIPIEGRVQVQIYIPDDGRSLPPPDEANGSGE